MSLAALSETGNDRIAMGANMSPFDAFKVNIDDLTEEAKAWLDGKAIASAAEADGVETLLDMARKTAKDADAARAAEKKPHLDAGKAVDAQWKPVIDGANRIADLAKRVLTPWREKLEAERRVEAERVAREAEEQRQREVEASRRAAESGSLEDREIADQEAAAAKQAERVAKKADKAATTGTGLRTKWVAEMVDQRAAIAAMWKRDPQAFVDLAQTIADQAVRSGARQIEGFNIIEQKVAI